MRPGFDLLLDLLRGQPHTTATAAEWNDALTVATQEHVLPLAVEVMRSAGDALPPEFRQRITELEREMAISAFWWNSELKGILRAFAADGTQVVLLKGPSLAERLYGNANRRIGRDLDLLVQRRDNRTAGQLLESLGFVPDPLADDYHRGWRRGTTLVELHVDVENPLAFDFDIASAWARTSPAAFAGEPCRLLAPADELLFLCLHGVRHRYERLSLVVDAARAIAALGPAIAPADFASGAPAKLKYLVMLGAAMAARIDPSLELPAGITLDNSHRRQLESIAAALWD